MAPKHHNPNNPRIDRKDNRPYWAQAPYNFVPLPEKMVAARSLFDHDIYQPEPQALTGWIECDLETCSPTYVRGMLTETQFKEFGQAKPDELTKGQKEQQAPFFSIEKIPLIPGSTLRGMTRSLVEIVGYGRMRWVADKPTFTFRAVAAASDDPLRDPYQDGLGRFGSKVRAGYLEKNRDEWLIRPAVTPQDKGWQAREPYLKVKERQIGGKDITGYLRFDSRDYQPGWFLVSFEMAEKNSARGGQFTAVTRVGDRSANYPYKGVLVCSGNMLETDQKSQQRSPRKGHTLILEANPSAQPLKISQQTVNGYLDGLTPFQEKLTAWGGNQGCLKEGAPVFYVAEGNEVIYFGHSPNFRIPARLAGERRAANPLDFVPATLRNNPEPDLADAIFGWVEEKENGEILGPKNQRAGRVFFSDACYVEDAEGIWFSENFVTPRTLSGPKPTTFQHYLVQDKRAGHNPDDKKSLAHYGSPRQETQIRGHKLYWHKGAAPAIEATAAEKEHHKQLTRISPLKPGVRFSFKVYFENLRPEELGVLYWALALPGEPGKTYRHKLGMGKPLGMGAVAITPRLYLTDRQERYSSFFQGETWHEAIRPAEAQPYLEAFETYLLQDWGIAPGKNQLTDVERIQTLLMLLEWREGDPDWLDKTRYMEIERKTGRWIETRNGRKEETVNEYKERPVLPDPFGVLNPPAQNKSSAPSQTQPKPFRQTGPTPPVTSSRPAQEKPIEMRSQPPVTPTKPSLPQVGELIQATVYFVDQKEGVYLELKGFSTDDIMGHIAPKDLGGRQYQEGDKARFLVLAVQQKASETVVACEPTGVREYRGTVKHYNPDKGLGVIEPEGGGATVVVRKSQLSGNLQALGTDQQVRFKIIKGMQGPEAKDVVLVE